MSVQPPFMVSYSITTKCNLKCKHCYSESVEEPSPDELSTEEAFEVIDQIAYMGVFLLILDGGEPLKREDFLEIARHGNEKGLVTVVGSNGTFIDRDTAKNMKDAGVRSVAISLDGATPEVHDSFRGEEGAFRKALEGAQACKTVGLPIQFGMVIRKPNLHQIPEMLKINDEFDTQAAEFFDLILSGRAKKEIAGEALSNEEREGIMNWLAEKQADYRVPIRVVACPMYTLLLQEKKIKPKCFDKDLLNRIPYYGRGCAAGVPMGYLVIRANGDIHPCMLLQINLGNTRKDKIASIWEESPVLRELRTRDKLKGYCKDCQHRDVCAGCRGRAYEETNDFMETDPGCWFLDKNR